MHSSGDLIKPNNHHIGSARSCIQGVCCINQSRRHCTLRGPDVCLYARRGTKAHRLALYRLPSKCTLLRELDVRAQGRTEVQGHRGAPLGEGGAGRRLHEPALRATGMRVKPFNISTAIFLQRGRLSVEKFEGFSGACIDSWGGVSVSRRCGHGLTVKASVKHPRPSINAPTPPPSLPLRPSPSPSLLRTLPPASVPARRPAAPGWPTAPRTCNIYIYIYIYINVKLADSSMYLPPPAALRAGSGYPPPPAVLGGGRAGGG